MSLAITSEHGSLPLPPIDHPRSWLARLLFRAMHRRYGMVPTGFRVLYGRSPYLAVVSAVVYLGLARFLHIEDALRMLLQVSTALDNGCTFCADLQLAEAARARVGSERFRALRTFESSPSFSPRERAALSYARAVSQSLHVPDDVWQALGAHFSERERIDIVWVCAIERYFNALALPLRIGSDHLAPPL